MKKHQSTLLLTILQGLNGALFGATLIVLVLRFALRVFGAGLSPFVSWIYGLSEDLLYPFRGVFEQITLTEPSGSVLELSTLFAILVYGLFYLAIQSALQYFEGVSREYTSSDK